MVCPGQVDQLKVAQLTAQNVIVDILEPSASKNIAGRRPYPPRPHIFHHIGPTPPQFALWRFTLAFRKFITSSGLRMLYNCQETPTERKYQSVTDQPTNLRTGVGAGDAYSSKT